MERVAANKLLVSAWAKEEERLLITNKTLSSIRNAKCNQRVEIVERASDDIMHDYNYFHPTH